MNENKNLEVFKSLVTDSVKDFAKLKSQLSYLPWAKAWELFKMQCPDATYEIIKNERNLPYFADETGIMVYTEVTVNGLTYQMWLPVMDSANRAMKLTPQQWTVKNKGKDGREYEKQVNVPAATMMDINKAVMRCLVKNIAMFGLGLHLYEGEDISIAGAEEAAREDKEKTLQLLDDYARRCNDGVSLLSLWTNNLTWQNEAEFRESMYNRLHALVNGCSTLDEIKALYQVSTWAHANQDFIDWCSERKKEIQNG